ncbi:MAG: hypothetical protein LJE95_10785, partial [Acidobacteria bacterium]|nr:hypothetical protein [Acidobacteriota bacterium]
LQPCSTRRSRAVFASCVTALAVFLVVGWQVAFSGPALVLDPVQIEVGEPGGWVLAGGMVLGRETWQPLYLTNVGSGSAARVGYTCSYEGLVSPPPLFELAVNPAETVAVWVEPEMWWLPWPGWGEFEHGMGPWPMRLVVADLAGGHVRRSASGVVFRSGCPRLALSANGSRTAALNGEKLTCFDNNTGAAVATIPLSQFPGLIAYAPSRLQFVNRTTVRIYTEYAGYGEDPTSGGISVFQADLSAGTVTRTADVVFPGWASIRFISPGARFLIVSDHNQSLTLCDGRTGALISWGQVVLDVAKEKIGFDVRPYLQSAPSKVSLIPSSLGRPLAQLQAMLFQPVF